MVPEGAAGYSGRGDRTVEEDAEDAEESEESIFDKCMFESKLLPCYFSYARAAKLRFSTMRAKEAVRSEQLCTTIGVVL